MYKIDEIDIAEPLSLSLPPSLAPLSLVLSSFLSFSLIHTLSHSQVRAHTHTHTFSQKLSIIQKYFLSFPTNVIKNKRPREWLLAYFLASQKDVALLKVYGNDINIKDNNSTAQTKLTSARESMDPQ